MECVLRLSVPAGGDLRVVAVDIAKRVAEYLRDARARHPAARWSPSKAWRPKLAPAATDAEITFDFREVNGELQIEAHCGSRSSEVRCPLPA